jgi:hypothetical protein
MDNELKLSTGAYESPVDPRDWTLASVGAPTVYPESKFLDTEWMVAAMQGHIGSCVGNTGEEMVRQIIYLTTGLQCNPGTENELSWRFVYAIAKCQDGVPDEGTFPSLVAKIIRKYGVPLAKYCPNEVTLDHESFVYQRNMANIPQEAFTDALTRKSGADMTVPLTEQGIMQAINYAADNKGGVMILRTVGDTYYTAEDGTITWDKDKILPIRYPKQITSGHEEFLTGYDHDENGRMRIYWLNHWSPQWADNGRGWEYADVWLPLIREMRCVVAQLPPAPPAFTYHFTKVIRQGNAGPDVVALQHALKLEGCFDYSTFTGFFGPITFQGVIKFQEKYAQDILVPNNLTHGNGFVGNMTLLKLNLLYNK